MRVPANLKPWFEARRRHKLSHAHVQMARELGMNPHKLGKIDNHRQKPWKLPIQDFIVERYLKQFGRPQPEVVRSLEEIIQAKEKRKKDRKARKEKERQEALSSPIVVAQFAREGWGACITRCMHENQPAYFQKGTGICLNENDDEDLNCWETGPHADLLTALPDLWTVSNPNNIHPDYLDWFRKQYEPARARLDENQLMIQQGHYHERWEKLLGL